LAAIAFIFIDIGFGTLHALFGRLWGVRDFGDTAGLPIIVIMFSLFGLLSTPLTNSITRANEAEADIFGLNAAREPDGFATIALKLAEYRKLDPTPWEEMVFYTHPSARSRIYMAMQWKAEHAGAKHSQPESASLEPSFKDTAEQVPEFAPPEFAPIEGEAEPPAFQDFPAAVGDR
jgi:STE24 endopeptidase